MLTTQVRRTGFTLIELLIVVAIIAILSAIAVPNFLEAQTRSKVARARSDMRTIATGLESYAIDTNRYPKADSFFSPMPSERLNAITTPIAYLSSIPCDPFPRRASGNYEASLKLVSPHEPLNVYLYNQATAVFGPGSDDTVTNRMSYSLTCGGPDLRIEFPYYAFADTFIQSRTYVTYVYDPTNGTVSTGELFRRGGNARSSLPGIDTW